MKNQRELVVARGTRFRSLESLTDACLKKVTARLWATCGWTNATIGDYRFVIFSVAPDKETSLFVQFWSEPGEAVACEVASGNWNAAALKFIGVPERNAIEGLGYSPSGGARNYRKLAVIQSMADAEQMAHEILAILFNVFRYRGQWKFEVERCDDTRADMAAVHTSVTPEDLLKLVRQAGYDAELKIEDSVPGVRMALDGRPSIGVLYERVPNQNLYAGVALRAPLPSAARADDFSLLMLSDKLDAARVIRADDGTPLLAQEMQLAGGVTLTWLRQQLGRWSTVQERAEALLRELPKTRKTRERVH